VPGSPDAPAVRVASQVPGEKFTHIQAAAATQQRYPQRLGRAAMLTGYCTSRARSPKFRAVTTIHSISHVSDTAFLVAHCRAVESARPDALFHDPMAERLAGEKGRAITDRFPFAPMVRWNVAIRTVIIDDFITSSIARGVDTVLCLGAGLDTRPYRLDLPSALTWIEVDYPDIIALKEERLAGEAPRCNLERVGLDLADLSARRELFGRVDAGAARILVVTEGVILYLEESQVAFLADDLRALANIDGWIVDYMSKESLAYRERAGVNRLMEQARFKFKPADWFGFFAGHGWRVREIRYLASEGARLGRRPALPRRIRLVMWLFGWLAPKKRREAFSRFAGYAILEPTTR
jgi:methyltransferase (TIGR00027 family)